MWSQNLDFTNSSHSAPQTYTSAGDELFADFNVEESWLYDVTEPIPEHRPTTLISSAVSSETFIAPHSADRIQQETRYATTRNIAKQRIRKKEPSKLPGNNRHGRAGRLRCGQCRAWRVKVPRLWRSSNLECEYNNPEGACKNCIEKGAICGPKMSARNWTTQKNQTLAEDTFSVIIGRRPISTLDNEPLTPFEEMHVSSVRENQILFRFFNLQLSRQDGRHLNELLFQRFGPTLSSKLARYGAILYSLYKHNDLSGGEGHRLFYLDGFYKSALEAVHRNAFADLVYGCFAVAMYGLRTSRPFHEVEAHIKAFRSSVQNLRVSESAIGHDETLLFECMWEKMLWNAAQILFTQPSKSGEVVSYLTQFTKPLFPSDTTGYSGWMHQAYLEVRTKLQFIQVAVKLSQSGDGEWECVRKSLQHRFLRDFLTSSEFSFTTDIATRANLRLRLRGLWSNFLLLMLHTTTTRPLPGEVIMETILSVHSIGKLADDPQFPDQLRSLFDMSICCLILIGLIMSKSQPLESLGMDSQNCRLIGLVLETVRANLSSLFWRCRESDNLASMVLFSQACERLSGVVQSDIPFKQSRIISEWAILCG